MFKKKMLKNGIQLIIFIFCMFSYQCLCYESNSMKNIAEKKLKEKISWIGNYRLITDMIDVQFFHTIFMYKIIVSDYSEPEPMYIVAIDVKKNAYIFTSDIDVEEFSRLMRNNKQRVDSKNILEFVNSFLLVVDYKSIVISDLDEIKYLPPFVREDKKIINLIKPLKFEINNQEIITEFFSWNNKGTLRKWNIKFSFSGEILQYHIDNVVQLSYR